MIKNFRVVTILSVYILVDANIDLSTILYNNKRGRPKARLKIEQHLDISDQRGRVVRDIT